MNIVKNIPNTITSMNLFCGVMGVIFTFDGKFDLAFYMMLAAAVCDFCDGLSARLLNAYSDMGKELDSLADMVSFGVLPSLMINRLMVDVQGESILCYVPLAWLRSRSSAAMARSRSTCGAPAPALSLARLALKSKTCVRRWRPVWASPSP